MLLRERAMADFKLMSYGPDRRQARAGVLVDDDVYDAERLTGNPEHNSVLGILESWPQAEAAIAAALDSRRGAAKVGPVAGQTVQAPVLYPGAIFCIASNYLDHRAGMARRSERSVEADPRTLGIKPFHFMKPPKQAVVGPYEDLNKPNFAQNFDCELELTAVIGRVAKNVSADEALNYVAGYTIGNDISVRDAVFARRPNVRENSPFNWDFISAKGFDNSCIIGPYITPASQIREPGKLSMKLWINDELRQDSNSSCMIFSTAEQISYLSERVTLQPGDLVLTGTPAGTGAERGRFLNKGETIRMWIENIGETRNLIV
jgi:2-keto-4-pentenoate hydratase/2-oxohepta-3-ene-1,7-dioic acid hydratase in catechol pathway